MLITYQSTNPCICTSQTTPSNPECQDECVCIKLCNISIPANSDAAVGPCAAEGTVDVSDPSYGHDLCACGAEPGYWSVHHFDETIFLAASIDRNTGVLTWTTHGPDSVGKYGYIIVEFCCGQLSAYMHVLIGVKDLCNCPNCDPCNDCDPCTGDCLDVQIDISIETTNPETTNMNINAN